MPARRRNNAENLPIVVVPPQSAICVSCNGCKDKKCPCRKKQLKCTIECHKGNPGIECQNLPELPRNYCILLWRGFDNIAIILCLFYTWATQSLPLILVFIVVSVIVCFEYQRSNQCELFYEYVMRILGGIVNILTILPAIYECPQSVVYMLGFVVLCFTTVTRPKVYDTGKQEFQSVFARASLLDDQASWCKDCKECSNKKCPCKKEDRYCTYLCHKTNPGISCQNLPLWRRKNVQSCGIRLWRGFDHIASILCLFYTWATQSLPLIVVFIVVLVIVCFEVQRFKLCDLIYEYVMRILGGIVNILTILPAIYECHQSVYVLGFVVVFCFTTYSRPEIRDRGMQVIKSVTACVLHAFDRNDRNYV